ncbi:MAG: GumC family protein [Syntrophobacteraceae bacterium]
MSHQNYPETSMRDFYNVLFRNKRRILIFFFSVMIVVTLGSFLASEVYQSQAELMVRLGRESVTLDPTATMGQTVSIGTDRENEVNSETAILNSRELAEKVVDAVGVKLILDGAEDTLSPDDSPLRVVRYWVRQAVKFPFTWISDLFSSLSSSEGSPTKQLKKRELAIERLEKELKIEVAIKSSIISISYETNDPGLAKDVLNRFIGFYLDKHINAHRTTGSYQFFDQQKESLQSSLAQTEENLRNLKNKTGTASIQDQRLILLQRIGGMQNDLGQTESAAAASEARVKALKASLARLPGTLQKDETTGFANSAADGMRKQIYDLELKEQELLSTFKENSIPVEEVRRQIREGRALLAKAEQPKQVTRGINENYQKMQLDLLTEESNLSSLQARAEALKTQLESGRGELNNLNDTEMRLAQLERDLETEKSNYRKYSDSREQTRIDQALELEKISNISIVQPASYPGKPTWPNWLLNIAIGLFLGLFGSVGLAFFTDYQDHSFKKPEDVDNRLNLPVLASLPNVIHHGGTEVTEQAWAATKRRKAIYHRGAEVTEKAKAYEMPLWADGNGNACRELLHLFAGGTLAAPCAVALVSCRPGEGVSTAAGLLARQSALQSGGRVLVVDANSRSPSQHVSFGTNLYPGLADFTSNGQPGLSCIQSTEIENLDVLSAGDGKPELSANGLKALADALPALKREYSHIIFDLPAVQEHSLAMQIAGLMDGVILVVEAESTRWEVAIRAKEDLLQANSKLLGVILNKRKMYIPQWLYKTL